MHLFPIQLILDSPREVQTLAFAPQNGNILVAGLANGQIAIWDLQGKIERVEQETKMTPDQVRYNAAMVSSLLTETNSFVSCQVFPFSVKMR